MRVSRTLAPLLLAVLVAACGGGGGSGGGAPAAGGGAITSNPDNARVAMTIGSKNFTEQQVLGQIYAQGLKASGYDVKTALGLGDENIAHAAIDRGAIDAYPEYTGTALLSFFGKKAGQLPKDPEQAYEEAKQAFATEGLVALA